MNSHPACELKGHSRPATDTTVLFLQEVSKLDAATFASEHDMLFFETSAKVGLPSTLSGVLTPRRLSGQAQIHVDEVFTTATRAFLDKQNTPSLSITHGNACPMASPTGRVPSPKGPRPQGDDGAPCACVAQ